MEVLQDMVNGSPKYIVLIQVLGEVFRKSNYVVEPRVWVSQPPLDLHIVRDASGNVGDTEESACLQRSEGRIHCLHPPREEPRYIIQNCMGDFRG